LAPPIAISRAVAADTVGGAGPYGIEPQSASDHFTEPRRGAPHYS